MVMFYIHSLNEIKLTKEPLNIFVFFVGTMDITSLKKKNGNHCAILTGRIKINNRNQAVQQGPPKKMGTL